MLPPSLNSGPDVIWRPIKGSSQEKALDTRCQVTLYTGARGPGKTDTQLMRFRRNVGKGYGPFWRGIIFDREYKNLDDLIAKSKRWFPRFEDGARFLESNSALKWVWPGGEELLFRAIKDPKDYWNYHGQEYPFIGWNELTKFPTDELFEMMMSCNRSSYTIDKDAPIDNETGERQDTGPIPLEVFATCNPYGPGHNWVKRRFITPAPFGRVIRQEMEVFNPQTQKKEKISISQVAIFGHWSENIYLDPIYVANLQKQRDRSKRKAWLKGDWNIVAGGAFDDVFEYSTHVLPRFPIPSGWRLDRGFDWGSTHPFSYGLFAEANGEEVELEDGRVFCPAPGSLIQVGEVYGTEDIGTNEGLKLSAVEVAKLIREYEEDLEDDEWINGAVNPGPADNQIRNVTEADTDTIEKKMLKEGIRFTTSDKAPGSRKIGLQLVRDRLEAAATGEGPALYFMENCRASIELIPSLPRDEKDMDDVDTDAEDHAYDMVRYRVLASGSRAAKKLKLKTPT